MTPLDGRLGLALFDDDNIQNPHPLYERMHQTGPVHRVGNSHFYAVSGWDAVNDAIARRDDFSSNLTATMVYRAGEGVFPFRIGELGGATQALATADEPFHSVHRKVVLPHLTARRIRDVEPFIARTADQLWDLAAGNGDIEWMAAMADQLPMMVVARIIGVPEVDVRELIRWGYSATQLLEGLVTEERLAAASTAVSELAGYIDEQFRRATADPREDLLGDLATACAGGDIDETAALIMMITLFSAGGESTAALIGTAARILATRPEIQHRVREQPELLGAFLEEVLRYDPPFRGHYRHVVDDTDLGGVPLPTGSRLLLLWGAANRDPRHVADPGEFRLDRAAPKNHLGFGRGPHFCVGAALARLEARIVIGRLLERTTAIQAVDTGSWLPSLLVRRLSRLQLRTSR